jgi:hypothetical protein
MQATTLRPLAGRSAGTASLQASIASGQRVLNDSQEGDG